MKSRINSKWFFTFIMVVLLMVIIIIPSFAQKKLQKSPGGYHGELDFPISWKQYYSYDELTKILHDLQKQYSRLADIQSIGKSRMGRDQYVLTITAKSTGNHSDKTAMWVDGALHGNEVNGITCSLYLSWYLLTRYDYDTHVYDLVNNYTFYILPGINVDANESYVSYPNIPHNPREPFRPEDNDGDGLYDEDRTEDVDGDGELSTMYIEDPKGGYKLSLDKRRFLPIIDIYEDVLRFRRIGSEGFDNDGDGMINEDDIGGPDPNRNFPAGWNLASGNPYTMSEPCTRNVWEFMRKQSNIYAGFHYHNAGRLIMFKIPTPIQREGDSAVQQQRRQDQLNNRLAEMRKTNKYALLYDYQVPSEYKHDLDVQVEIATMGNRILKNYRPTPTSGAGGGSAPAATYFFLGAYSYLIELWGWDPIITTEADANNDGVADEEEILKWSDIELGGEGWIIPHKCNHPDLGEIWIGGTPKKHLNRTPPARYIEMEALKNSQFVMYCASQFPKVELDEVSVKPAAQDLYWIDVSVKNDRIYPTFSDRAIKIKIAVKDKLTLNSSKNITMIDASEGLTKIYPFYDTRQCTMINKKVTEFRLKGREMLRFSALVKIDGSKGWVEFDVKSKHGGTDRRRINININN